MLENVGIRIPMYETILDNTRKEVGHVLFFPDELPEDHQILSDVLRSEFASFKVWRSCALEYHRQGFDQNFEALLKEIVEAIEDPDIDRLYRDSEKEEYLEGIMDIYVALAAKSLSNLSQARSSGNKELSFEYSKKFVEYLKSADEKQRLNEYTWLIKAFFEVVQGEFKRAETNFHNVYERATKGQNALKKKYLFGSLIGLGMVSYANQKHEQSLNYFVKAVHINHCASGHTVRLAIACCCFKLHQYDRAKIALEKCLSIDPTDPNIFVLLALIEQESSKKDRAKRVEYHTRAFEYSVLANELDPNNSQSLILLANHHFHSWRTITFESGCYIVDSIHLLIPFEAVQDCIAPNNQLKINNIELANGTDTSTALIHTIVAIYSHDQFGDVLIEQLQKVVVGINLSQFVVVQISTPIPEKLLNNNSKTAFTPITLLEIKDLARVKQFAEKAVAFTNLPTIMAEGNYILGKVAHTLKDAGEAFDYYWKALKDAPEMALAAFGAAQILMSKNEFSASLELFEKVLLKNPDDKDTQAYVMLLKAIIKGQQAQFDKLREIAPGFQYEIDLWLIQGKLRQKDPQEHKNALKCYLNAKECIKLRYNNEGFPISVTKVPPEVLSNISVLHHSLGKLDKALKFSKETLRYFQNSDSSNTTNVSPVFQNADLEDIFYSWSKESICYVECGNEIGHFVLSAKSSNPHFTSNILSQGDEILIGDIKHKIDKVISTTEIICSSPVKLDSRQQTSYELRIKVSFNNFIDETITYVYNLARLLEDGGQSKAATEIYIELLKRHPSFIECYLRLSLISFDLGKFDEASVWLSRALVVNEDEPDATLCLGDLFNRCAQLEDAKKCYDKICQKNRHDSRAMLSLGNFYYAFSSNAKSESQLKDSYKFFFHVLNENHNNAYAVNGLGMVCVEKQEIDAAREMFSKAREANVSKSEDICTNLSHVYVIQNRLVDAERLYQSTIKSLSRTGRSFADKYAHLNECVAYTQHKHNRQEDAIKSMFRALHLNPTNFRFWYNVAFVGENLCGVILQRKNASVKLVEEGKRVLNISKKVFKSLSLLQQQHHQHKLYERKLAGLHSSSCSEKRSQLEKLMQNAIKEATRQQAERDTQEQEHNARKKSKDDLKEKEIMAIESDKLQKQQVAELKMQKLKELQEKWYTTQTTTEQVRSSNKTLLSSSFGGTGTGGVKKRRRNEKDFFFDKLDDDEINHIPTNKAQSDEIDFGSSSDESNEDKYRISSNLRVKQAQLKDDIFGDDSDEEADKSIDQNVNNQIEIETQRKRLKKSTNIDNSNNNNDDDDEFDDVIDNNISKITTLESEGKKKRIIDDDSD